MIDSEKLQKLLCNAFCAAISVEPQASGLAVSSVFTDRSGDPIDFHVVEDADGYRIEDDGGYLSNLVASGIDVDTGTRGNLLSAILDEGGAYWDQDTFVIRSNSFQEEQLPGRMIAFISALIKVRDLELITREVVRSTFREDAMSAICERFEEVANIEEGQPIDKDFVQFPSDAIIRPKQETGISAAVYFVTTNEHLAEAQLLQAEAERLHREDFSVIALVEALELPNLSKKKFQRAQNRSLTMPIFRGDEAAALTLIERQLKISPTMRVH